jgi:DNA-binding CsgD family transcriptional regulator
VKPRSRREPPRPPPDPQALQSEDGEVVILSFAIPDGEPSALSPVESEVVALVLQGHSNSEIARLRGTSVRTVANQVASVFRKLGVRSRLELVAHAAIALGREK